MTLQGLVVLAIVSVAAWAVLQHVRALFAPARKKGRSSSCHGCDDCGER